MNQRHAIEINLHIASFAFLSENPELAGQFGVMSIPTLVVMKSGKIVNQSMGAKSKSAILAML